jgi:glycoside/pentoside/hexuronide:cation symporter, GPH family
LSIESLLVRRHSWRHLLAYGLLSIPLAMAALPIYVHVPNFYAKGLGLDLAAIGGLLLLARGFDAVIDPLLGYWSDLARDSRAGRLVFIALGVPVLALGMLGLFSPPQAIGGWLPWWLLGMLLLVYTAFSMMQISYQAYGAEISRDPAERTRITAFREGLGLAGVLLAAWLPQVLSDQAGMRQGYAQYTYIFIPILLGLATLTIFLSPRAIAQAPAALAGAGALKTMLKPLKNALFNRLLVVFIFNGIAASIPATLLLFYVADVLKSPQIAAASLGIYFIAGAAGMPLWVWLSARIGKGRAWFVGMVMSIIAFVWAFMLGAGDTNAFLVICALSGLGLGADLALPPSILADVIDVDERRGLGRSEGAYFGLWTLVTKANLALAAGIALPALAFLGYAPDTANSPGALVSLAAVYALLPCLLKAVAAAALIFSPFFQRDEAREFPLEEGARP